MPRKVVTDISTLPPTQRASAAEQRVDELLKPADVVILNSAQETALLALLDGKLQKDAAKAAGVSPETVCRWLANDSGFVAELNRRRSELWHAQRDRVRKLADAALDELDDLLHSTSPKLQLEAIKIVLSTAATMSHGIGPETPAGVEKMWFQERSNDQIGTLDLVIAGLV
jgi:hypothetical protein